MNNATQSLTTATRTAGRIWYAEIVTRAGEPSARAFVTTHGATLNDCVVSFTYAQSIAAYSATRNVYFLDLCRNVAR